MGDRLDLQTILETVLGSDKVYFQPPASLQLSYPCIVYERSTIRTYFAGNSPYNHKIRYKLTLIDKDPDSSILAKIASLPMCSYDRPFTANNLNHDVFNIYY